MKGLSGVLRALNKSIEGIRKGTVAGLTEAALIVKRDSVKGTPIDLGNLRGSAYIIVTGKLPDNQSPNFSGSDSGQLTGDHDKVIAEATKITKEDGKEKPVGIVGYSANYAWYVHEMPSHYNFNSGSNQFLLKALVKNQNRIKQIIAKWAKI